MFRQKVQLNFCLFLIVSKVGNTIIIFELAVKSTVTKIIIW